MYHEQRHIVRKVFISAVIALTSLCVTFICLYLLIPKYKPVPTLTATSTPAPTIAKTPVVTRTVAPALAPIQLQIDSINVAAVINPVGLNALGDMDIDENPEAVAWYQLGVKPGEEGSAVIAGHYGWKNGVASVFNDLNKLVAGDVVSTIGEDGKVQQFKVIRSAMYTPDQDATDVFRSDDGKAHLNLVTCQGSWNNTQSTYSDRLVVFTELVT